MRFPYQLALLLGMSCGVLQARVDPAYLATAAATGGEVIDAPRAVMAAGVVPISLDRYFATVEFRSPRGNPLFPHVNSGPIRILRSGQRELTIVLNDRKQTPINGFVLLDAKTQNQIPFTIKCTQDGSNNYCRSMIEVPKRSFYIAVRYPTSAGEVLRIHGHKFSPKW